MTSVTKAKINDGFARIVRNWNWAIDKGNHGIHGQEEGKVTGGTSHGSARMTRRAWIGIRQKAKAKATAQARMECRIRVKRIRGARHPLYGIARLESHSESNGERVRRSRRIRP